MADFNKKTTLIEVEIDNAAAMAEVKNLSNAIIEQKDVISRTTASISDLNKENKALNAEVKAGTKTREEANKIIDTNVERINKLKLAQLANKDELTRLNAERKNAIKASKLQSNSLDALRKKVIEQKKELNGLNTATEEGRKRFDELSKSLKDNNEKIRDLDQSAGDFKTTVGNYREEIVKAAKDLNDLKNKSQKLKEEQKLLDKSTEEGVIQYKAYELAIRKTDQEIVKTEKHVKQLDEGFTEFEDVTDSGADALDNMTGGLASGTKGFLSMTKAALRFLLTPLGLFLGAVALTIGLVTNAMSRNEESSNKLKKAFSAFSGIVNFLLKALEPLGEFLIDGIVKGFELAAEAADKAVSFISSALETLGFDKAAASVKKYSDELKLSVQAAQQLAEAEANLQREQRVANKVMLDYQKQAEKLRQIRDDDTLSFKARIKANEDLGAVLKAQLDEEKRIAQIGLDAANLRIKLEGESTEALDARAEALTNLSDIEERITGQQSEQLVNRNALERDRTAKLKEEADKRKSIRDAAQAVEDEGIEKEKEKEKELQEARVKNTEEANNKLFQLNEFRRLQQAEAYIQDASTFQEYLDRKSEMEAADFALKTKRLAAENLILQENEALTKEEKLIAEYEYQLAIEELEAGHAERMLEIKEEQADKEKDLEQKKREDIQRIAQASNEVLQNGFQASNNLINGFYDKRFREIKSQYESGAITEEQFQKKSQSIERQRAKDVYKSALVQHRIEKATNLASVGFSTAAGIMKAVKASPLTGGLPWSAVIGAQGLAQGIAIATKPAPQPPTFAQGGDVFGVLAGGRDHAFGGTKYFGEDGNAFEVQSNEGIFVTKREATNPALQALNSINTQHGGSSMFSGGSSHLAEGGAANMGGINEKSLSLILEDMVMNLPTPVLPVQDVMAGINERINAKKTGVI